MVDILKVREKIQEFIEDSEEVFLKIAAMKNLSKIYNPNWEKDGDFLSCFKIMEEYINSLNIPAIKNLQIFQESSVTPALFFSATSSDVKESYTILMYSHIDKIPFGTGWTRCQPESPRIVDGYLYGRGTSNGLYAIFTILGMIKALDELSLPRPNIAILIESSFESGSPDLLINLTKSLNIIPTINQVICLDTWTPTNEHFHYMKSCRGIISFNLKVTTGLKPVHSGGFGGIIPDPMMIFNNILSNKIEKIEKSEDLKATNIKIPELEVDITESQQKECQEICNIVGFKMYAMIVYETISELIGSKNEDSKEDFLAAYINGVLRPSYSILGFEDMPDIENASGSLKPYINARLLFRTPPSLDINEGYEKLEKLIKENPPFGAKIEISDVELCYGFDLEENNNNMSEKMVNIFSGFCNQRIGNEALGLRLARSMPCLNYLSAKFKNVPFFVTGAGNTYFGNPRESNEGIQLSTLIDFSTCLTCYISEYNKYKE